VKSAKKTAKMRKTGVSFKSLGEKRWQEGMATIIISVKYPAYLCDLINLATVDSPHFNALGHVALH